MADDSRKEVLRSSERTDLFFFSRLFALFVLFVSIRRFGTFAVSDRSTTSSCSQTSQSGQKPCYSLPYGAHLRAS